jgi:hypothetical protein
MEILTAITSIASIETWKKEEIYSAEQQKIDEEIA